MAGGGAVTLPARAGGKFPEEEEEENGAAEVSLPMGGLAAVTGLRSRA